jgi:hypothetical protein
MTRTVVVFEVSRLLTLIRPLAEPVKAAGWIETSYWYLSNALAPGA